MKRCITLKKLNADWCHYIQFHLSPFILIPCDMTHQKQLSTESELSWHKKKNIAGVVRKHRWWLTYRSIFLCRNKASLLFQDFFFFFVSNLCPHLFSQPFVLSNLCPPLFAQPFTLKSLSTIVFLSTPLRKFIYKHDQLFVPPNLLFPPSFVVFNTLFLFCLWCTF